MLTDGLTVDVTVMASTLDVDVTGFEQGTDEIMTTLTWSPFTNELLE